MFQLYLEVSLNFFEHVRGCVEKTDK